MKGYCKCGKEIDEITYTQFGCCDDCSDKTDKKEKYLIIRKNKTDFQKILNQWKRIFDFEIMWMSYDTTTETYHALIKREVRG